MDMGAGVNTGACMEMCGFMVGYVWGSTWKFLGSQSCGLQPVTFIISTPLLQELQSTFPNNRPTRALLLGFWMANLIVLL